MQDNAKKNWIVSLDERGYYSKDHAWQYVDQASATKMTRKEARKVAAYLKQPRIGYKTDIEETKDNIMEPSYPTIDYPARCSYCGQPCNPMFIWEDMSFCSESCMNFEKEYWHDCEQMRSEQLIKEIAEDLS